MKLMVAVPYESVYGPTTNPNTWKCLWRLLHMMEESGLCRLVAVFTCRRPVDITRHRQVADVAIPLVG